MSVAHERRCLQICQVRRTLSLLHYAANVCRTAGGAYSNVFIHGNPLRDSCKRLDLIRTLAEGVECENPLDLETSVLGDFRGKLEILSWILHDSDYSGQALAIEDRARLAIYLGARVWQPRVASLMRHLLPGEQDILAACQVVDSCARTLIHSATWALGEQAFRAGQSARIKPHGRTKASGKDFEFNHQAESECLQDLLLLIGELIAAGSNLHGCAGRYVKGLCLNTPLTAIISSFGHFSYLCLQEKDEQPPIRNAFFDLPIPAVNDVYIPLMMWLELLYEGGIDLADYGRKENQMLRKGPIVNSFSFAIWRRLIGGVDCTLEGVKDFSISFKYGPKPSDWQFWLIEKMDDSFVEFWDMVDHPERVMPGSWDECFDDWE
jgi:hypothetical protein